MRGLWAVVILIALSGCGPPGEGVAGVAASSSPDAAAVRGELAGDPALEGGCVWLDTGDRRLEILWPEGYRATAEPLELRDPTGAVVAVGGDELIVRGGPATDHVSTCQVGALWRADDVTAP